MDEEKCGDVSTRYEETRSDTDTVEERSKRE